MDLIQSAEDLTRTKADLPEQEGILPGNYLLTQIATTPWVLSLLVYPADSGFTKPPQLHEDIP